MRLRPSSVKIEPGGIGEFGVIVTERHVVNGIEVTIDDPQVQMTEALSVLQDRNLREGATLMGWNGRESRIPRDRDKEALTLIELVSTPPGTQELLTSPHKTRILALAQQVEKKSLVRRQIPTDFTFTSHHHRKNLASQHADEHALFEHAYVTSNGAETG